MQLINLETNFKTVDLVCQIIRRKTFSIIIPVMFIVVVTGPVTCSTSGAGSQPITCLHIIKEIVHLYKNKKNKSAAHYNSRVTKWFYR